MAVGFAKQVAKVPVLSVLDPKALSAVADLGKLRQLTCPGCGLKYWTNRLTDLCTDCQKKDNKIT